MISVRIFQSQFRHIRSKLTKLNISFTSRNFARKDDNTKDDNPKYDNPKYDNIKYDNPKYENIKVVNETISNSEIDSDMEYKFTKLELQRTFGFVNLIEKLPKDSDILTTLNDIRIINHVYIFKGHELSIYRKNQTRKEIMRLLDKYDNTKYRDLFVYVMEYYKLRF